MMKYKIAITLLFLCTGLLGQGFQRTERDAGNIVINSGTSIIFNTLTIGYESPSLLGDLKKHKLRLGLHSGLWHASLFNSNLGVQIKPQFVYLLGNAVHQLEVNYGIALYLDSNIDEAGINYIGRRQTFYMGYRLKPKTHSLFFKLGAGYPELLQLGVGYQI